MRSKIFIVLPILVISFLIGGYQLTQAGNIRDITGSANNLISQLEETIREVNSKAETGELEDAVADMTEEILGRTLEQVTILLEKNQGTLFASANGTIDNIFNNISNQVEQIRTGYLDESFPRLIDQISSEMTNSTNRLSAEAQDIIMLAAGSTYVAVDKATNFMVTILSIVLLAVGLLVLTIFLLKAKKQLNKTRIAGLIIGGIYILFFLAILLVAPLRGYVIAGFNYGVEVEAKALTPKITGISPSDFVFGENDTITIYGNHLNLIKDLSVKLAQGSEVKKVFQDATVAVATSYSIVLGNLNKEPDGWLPIDFKTQWNDEITTSQQTADAFLEYFGFYPGQYGVSVYSGDQRIESPQHIQLTNPIPPAPKPDIIPIEMNWSSPAVINETSSLRITLKITHPTEVKRDFTVKVIETSSGSFWTQTVDKSIVGNAEGDGTCEVIVSGIRPSKTGNQNFKIITDSSSVIEEKDESNNEYQASLKVGQYVYDAHLTIDSFNPFRNYDDTDNEFRITVTITYQDHKEEIKVNRNGRANKTYGINWKKDYQNVQPGQVFSLYTTGYEADAGTFYDSHDNMGNNGRNITIDEHITDGRDAKDLPILLETFSYRIHGNIHFTRRIQ